MELELMDQQKVFTENELILQQFGWEIHQCGNGHTWFRSLQTNQWSPEVPLRVLLSDDLKQLLDQHVAEAPPSGNVVHTRLSTPPPRIGPSSSHSSHEAPPPPLGPPPPMNNQIHQSSGACVTSTASPPPLAILPMIPNIK